MPPVGTEVPAQVCAQAAVVVYVGARQHFFPAPPVHGGVAAAFAGGAQSGGKGLQVVRVRVVVRVDQGWRARLSVGQPDRAAAAGKHQRGGEGVALADSRASRTTNATAHLGDQERRWIIRPSRKTIVSG